MDRHSRRPLLTAALFVAAAGSATGLAAAARIGPFDALSVATHTVAASVVQAQITARQLYPTPTAPPTIHQIVEINDPPRVIAPAPQLHSAPVAAPTHEPTAEATPSATSSPTACPEDCGGGGGGGGGGDN